MVPFVVPSPMPKQTPKSRKKKPPKRVLALPDLVRRAQHVAAFRIY